MSKEIKFEKADELANKRKQINILKQEAMGEALRAIQPQVELIDVDIKKLLKSRYKFITALKAALLKTLPGTKLSYKIKGRRYTAKMHLAFKDGDTFFVTSGKEKLEIKYTALSEITISDAVK
mgnify:CR=1 FL=1